MNVALGVPRIAGPAATADTRPLLAGFLAVQFFLGYEWLMSGLSKIMADNFPGTLAGTLSDSMQDQTGWYKDFVDGVVIPNAQTFGYLVMIGEVAVGVTLIATALVWLVRWSRMSLNQRSLLLGIIALTTIVGAFMSLNFHLAMGATAPWMISPDPNDQGVDLDSLMVMVQLAFAAVALVYLVRLRRHVDA